MSWLATYVAKLSPYFQHADNLFAKIIKLSSQLVSLLSVVVINPYSLIVYKIFMEH